jgi:hypothetical protein
MTTSEPCNPRKPSARGAERANPPTQADFDLYPVVRLRPILTPPRTSFAVTRSGTGDTIPDPELWTYYDPIAKRVVVTDDSFTHFPALIERGAGSVIVGRLGAAVFIGPHLLAPARRDRLVRVLNDLFASDVLLSNRQWIQSMGVPRQHASRETLDELRDAGARGRGKAPVQRSASRELELA